MKKLFLTMCFATFVFISCTEDNKTTEPETKKGELAGKVVKKGEVYKLDAMTYTLNNGSLIVENGGKLVIPAGTTIKAKGGKTAYVAVKMGGKIDVQGTKDKPVVMTSGEATPKSQDWGGFIVCGKAKTNVGANATAEVAGLTYGGNDNSDSSGSIKYLQVAYTGAIISPKKEFNGITFYAVGKGTTVENIASYKGSDDGVEFFGGSVNVSNIVLIDSDDDSLDFADGYSGTIKNVYIKGVTKAGVECSNNEANGDKTPVTTATVENVSIVAGGGTTKEGAIYFKEGGGNITFKNVYVDGFALGVKVKDTDAPALARIGSGKLVINPIQFANNVGEFNYGIAKEKMTEADNSGAGSKSTLPSWASWAKK